MLSSFDPLEETFLTRRWQREPHLFRRAFPGFESPLPPEDLAALACRDDVESRLVLEQGGAMPWELRDGPFDDDDFAALPATHWTLLVHEVDRIVPEVAALLERFRFVPNWRLDDVMVSYAAPRGSVGAHVDRYDVFLLQGAGRRRWRIDSRPLEREELRPDVELPVLARFTPDREWVLEPGDMLYLPPGIAHEGVALDACMTFSIGFRAPSRREAAAGMLRSLIESSEPDVRYAGGGIAGDDPGRLDDAVLDWVGATLRGLLDDRESLARWFGRFVTEPRRASPAEPADGPTVPAELVARLRSGGKLRRRAVPELAWFPRDDGGAILFAAGESIELSAELAPCAPRICGSGVLDGTTLAPFLDRPGCGALLAGLVDRGVLRFDGS
jgi:50S ribosomal protein L16 3-hydroxylase